MVLKYRVEGGGVEQQDQSFELRQLSRHALPSRVLRKDFLSFPAVFMAMSGSGLLLFAVRTVPQAIDVHYIMNQLSAIFTLFSAFSLAAGLVLYMFAVFIRNIPIRLLSVGARNMYETAITTFFMIAIATAIPVIIWMILTGEPPPPLFEIPV